MTANGNNRAEGDKPERLTIELVRNPHREGGGIRAAVQERIFSVLLDGMPHSRQELMDAIDEYATVSQLNKNIDYIRTKIRPRGLDVVCVLVHKRICYRLVRPITTD